MTPTLRALTAGLTLAATLALAAPPAALAQDDRPDPAVDQAAIAVLRTGCLDLDQLAALRAAGQASASPAAAALADELLRLCEELRRGGVASAAPAAVPAAHGPRLDRRGRAKLVGFLTLYGLWTGIAVDIIAEVDDFRLAMLAPLAGVGAGLGLSLHFTEHGPLTSGQAWTAITGFDYGTYSGFLLAAALDLDSGRAAVGTALGTGLAGGALASAIAFTRSPTAGDAELVRSGGLWGFGTGALAALILRPDRGSTWATMMLAGMDGGLLAGTLLAQRLNISRNRMLLIDAGGLAGAVVGFGSGVLALGAPESSGRARVVGGITLACMWGGLLAAAYLTRHMDEELEDDHHITHAEPPAALVTLSSSGRWGLGRLVPQPVFADTAGGPRPVGAALPLLGGSL